GARFTATRDPLWALAAGALLGLAFAAKGVAAVFVPVVPVLAAAEWRAWDRAGLRRFLAGLAGMAVTAWIAVLAVYRFSGFPLPAPVLAGIRFQVASSSSGEFPAFLNGAWSQTGWWYYYVVALLYKAPLPLLLLIAIGAWTVVRARLRRDG